MKALSEQEQQQLNDLLAKQEAAKKLDEQVQEAVERIKDSKEKMVMYLKKHQVEYTRINKIYDLLNAEDSKMFSLVEKTKIEKVKVFPTYGASSSLTTEQKQAAFDFLKMEAVDFL